MSFSVEDYIATDLDLAELPLFAAARRSDPPTSRIAARMAGGLVADHHRRILEALELGPAGKTEIGLRCGLTEQQVARRMHELRRAGQVERTGRRARSASGRPEDEYRHKSESHGVFK